MSHKPYNHLGKYLPTVKIVIKYRKTDFTCDVTIFLAYTRLTIMFLLFDFFSSYLKDLLNSLTFDFR